MDPISTGIAVGGSLINGLLQGDQNRKNREWQSKENQKARDYNTMMWEKNNAYNDPATNGKTTKCRYKSTLSI